MQAATRLLGRYPKGAAEDAVEYMQGISTIFADYHEDLMDDVVDTLPDQVKWLPTPYDVRQACNARLRQISEPAAYAARIAEQLEERKRFIPKSPQERSKRVQFIAEQRAQYGHYFGLDQDKANMPAPNQAFTYAQFEAWCRLNSKSPRPIGAFEPGSYLGPDKQPPVKPSQTNAQKALEARQSLIDQIGHEAFNAIPDAPAPSASPMKGHPDENSDA